MSHSKSSGILGCSSLWKVYWRIAPHQPTQWAQTASLAHIPPGAWFFKLWERGENHEDFTPPKNSTILSSPQDLMFFLSFQKKIRQKWSIWHRKKRTYTHKYIYTELPHQSKNLRFTPRRVSELFEHWNGSEILGSQLQSPSAQPSRNWNKKQANDSKSLKNSSHWIYWKWYINTSSIFHYVQTRATDVQRCCIWHRKKYI